MLIHSKFLIHWTGRDFHVRNSPLTQDLREQYVQRLRDDCEKGFFMKKGRETIHGVGGAKINADISRVCFSEVRLSQAEKHAKMYGMLGIGVHRDFVIERGGNPVLYVRNGDTDMVTQNLANVYCFLADKAKDEDNEKEKQVLSELGLVLGFIKGMSHQNDSEFLWYEEMEWRIVHVKRLEGKYFTVEDATQHFYRVNPLYPQDVKILIFPDYDTKQMAIGDDGIKKFFKYGFPMMTTVEDCKSF